jgi:lactate dehydrogenase-like 2-hydroxyacid dehydrogenase
MKPDVYYQVPKYIKKYGVKAAVDVARFEASQVHAVKELVEKEKIDCDFVLTRACDATLDPELARDTHNAFTELQKSGVANLKDVFYAHGKEAEEVSHS